MDFFSGDYIWTLGGAAPRCVDGTISVDLAADRRRRRTSAVLCSVSARYEKVIDSNKFTP